MAANEQTLVVELTKGALDHGYISVPAGQSLFPGRFIAGEDGKSQERFSIEIPSGEVVRTCILGNYRRLQARFGSLFKRLGLQPGDRAVISRTGSAPDRYVLTFEVRAAAAPAKPARAMEPSPMTPDLNRILYGPPGTGKTFATVDAALEVLDPDFLSANAEKRDVLKGRFDELVAAGDIRFVTFHQSFSYEDFVEGLRAETDDNGLLRYEIVDGVFKSLCAAAEARVTQQEEAPINLDGRRIWKMSLGNSLGDDAYIFDECIENNCALLGYGGSTDFSDCKDRDGVFKRFIQRNESVTRDSYPVSAVNTFLFKMKEVEKLTTDQLIRWRNKVATAPKRVRTKRTAAKPATRETPDDDDARRARKATANRITAMLKAALNRAFYADRISSDGAWRKVRPFKRVDEAVVRYLSIPEARRLVDACPDDFRNLVEAALYTGCRYAELTRLRYEDYSDDSGTLSVRLSKGKDRHVVLTDEAKNAFRRWTKGSHPGERIFLRQDGKAWGTSHQRRPLDEASHRAAIVPTVNFHILRHTHASLLAMVGVPMAVIARQLGHADTRMTEKHYAHLAPNYVAQTIRENFPVLGIANPPQVIQLSTWRG